MKHISLRFGVVLLTFMIGVGAAWSYRRVLQPVWTASEPKPVSKAPIASALSSADKSLEAVKFTLVRSYRNADGLIYAEFEVVNATGEPLYYQGYSDGSNEFWSVRRGNRSTRYAPFCGSGLSERELQPRESAEFHVVVGRTGGSLQVGFDFFVGEKRLRQTNWSGTVDINES